MLPLPAHAIAWRDEKFPTFRRGLNPLTPPFKYGAVRWGLHCYNLLKKGSACDSVLAIWQTQLEKIIVVDSAPTVYMVTVV